MTKHTRACGRTNADPNWQRERARFGQYWELQRWQRVERRGNMKGSVIDNPAQHRFELPVGGAIAVAAYRLEGERVILVHTEVPQELSGQGIGSKLAEGVFEAIQ